MNPDCPFRYGSRGPLHRMVYRLVLIDYYHHSALPRQIIRRRRDLRAATDMTAAATISDVSRMTFDDGLTPFTSPRYQLGGRTGLYNSPETYRAIHRVAEASGGRR